MCSQTAVTACPAGTYSPALSTKCLPCPAGSQCPTSGAGATPCTSGQWSLVGATTCQDCPTGYHCPTTDKPPIRCQSGTQANAVKQITCPACAATFQCSDPTAPTLCPQGYYSSAGASYCIMCPEGSACTGGAISSCSAGSTYAFSGQNACSPCQSGYFCSTTNHYKCPPGTYESSGNCVTVPDPNYSADQINLLTCAAGTYRNADKTGCINCPEGHVCAGGASSPVACSTGQYVNGNTCTTCPSGQTCRHSFLTPSSCTDGYYLESNGSYCALCPRGYFCTGSVKTVCPTGQSSFQGASSCFSLTKVTFTSTLYPIPAPYGFYKDSGGNIAQCPENSYCPSPFHDPIACPSGWWSPAGLWTCVPNAPGGNAPYAFGTSTPTAPKNYEMGSDYLFPCPAGMYANAGSGKCTMIESAQGWDTASQVKVACDSGYYSPEGETWCRPVPAGFSYSGSGDPTICAGGTFSPSGKATCTACPDGTWSESGAEVCLPCPAGYKCDSQNSIALCLKGQYSLTNSLTCSPCALGFICYPGSDTPTPAAYSCPKGYYCPLSGTAIVQTACPAGNYGTMQRATTEAQGCEPCPAGYVCPSAAQDYIWYPCPPNHYCTRGTTAATACPDYTYFPGLKARAEHECRHVPEGYYLNSGTVTICPLGSYCPAKNTVQTCPNGTYNQDEGSISVNSCIPCPPGHFCTGGFITGASAVLKYLPLFGAAGPNEYRVPPGSSYNAEASALYYLLQEEANKVAEIGMAAELCENGLYAGYNGLNQDDCVRCRLGKDCSDGLNEQPCAQGKYCPHTEQNYSFDCPRGTYGAATGLKQADECTPCPAGKFCPGGGTATQNCPTGFYCPAQTPYPVRCPEGYYGGAVDLTHLSGCTICEADSYCRDGFKTQCPKGTYQPAKGEAECLPCPGGYKCDDGSGNKVREVCPKGQYSAPGDPEGCVNCPKGYACRRRGISMVDLPLFRCENGYNCNTAGTTDAVLLKVYGQYSLAGILYDCPEGFYHLKYGATSLADCKRIPAGFYSTIADFKTSNGQLLLCPSGHYCPEGTYSPVPCPKRTFNPVKMAKDVTECFECLAGFYCPNEGMNTYTDCPLGSYCPDGTDKPERCPSGTYDSTGKLKSSAECTLCPAGFYCPDRGMTSVPASNQCYAGFYCQLGSPQPDPISKVYGDLCPAGSFCPLGASSPQACPAGQYNPNSGAKSAADCAPCTPGFYCLGDNSSSPTGQCKGGFYCPAGSVSETAQSATAGNYAPTGSPIQIPCPPGTYSSNNEQAACTNCEKGKYCPDQGMTSSQVCPVGFYCPSKEQQDTDGLIYNKIPCVPGTYRDTTGAESLDDCVPCPGGKACPFYGLSVGTTYDCKAGFFCLTRATSANPAIADTSGNFGPCPKGRYCPAATTTPQQCLAGTFMPYEGARAQSECIPCHPGMYCSSTGLEEPEGICRAGYYCPESSTSDTAIQCPIQKYCPRGSGAPRDCPSGMYQDQAGAYRCDACQAGNYCEGGAQTECKAGTYCPGN